MPNLNVCLTVPDGYSHYQAFSELAELVSGSARILGYNSAISTNRIFADARNVVFGAHLTNPDHLDLFPADTIIFNTEQISHCDESWSENIIRISSKYQIWDYSYRNVEILNKFGANDARYFRIGYIDQLNRIISASEKDIDVLFYGSTNERRCDILERLQAIGTRVVHLFDCYGAERDAAIARSKIVLNMHMLDSKIFEIVRAFYLMSNAKAVVSEVGADTAIDPCYRDGVLGCEYDDLVDHCRRLLNSDEERHELERRALATIQKLPQEEILRDLLR